MDWERVLWTAVTSLLAGAMIAGAYRFGREFEGEKTWRTWLTGFGVIGFVFLLALGGGRGDEDYPESDYPEPDISRLLGFFLAVAIAFTAGFIKAKRASRWKK